MATTVGGNISRYEGHVVRTALRLLAMECDKTMKQETKIGVDSEETGKIRETIFGTDTKTGLLKFFSEDADQGDAFHDVNPRAGEVHAEIVVEGEEGDGEVIEAEITPLAGPRRMLSAG